MSVRLFSLLRFSYLKFFTLTLSLLVLIIQIVFTLPDRNKYIDFTTFPKVYDYIRDETQKSDVIAIYPIQILEPKNHFYQVLMRRRIINATQNLLSQPLLNAGSLGDPNSVDILRQLKANYILLTNQESPGIVDTLMKRSDLKLVYKEQTIHNNRPKFNYLLKILGGNKSDYYANFIQGFHLTEYGLFSGTWTKSNFSIIKVKTFPNKRTNQNKVILVFGISTNGREVSFSIKQDSKLLYQGLANNTTQELRIEIDLEREIVIQSGDLYYLNPPNDMRIGGLFLSSVHAISLKE
jgi:hypothetical protein